VIEYALKLGSALTVARVGFYLEQPREQLNGRGSTPQGAARARVAGAAR